MANLQKITPFLWFDGRAKEAALFYTSVFDNSAILSSAKLEPGTNVVAHTVEFELSGQRFTALDGGPLYQFTPAISFVVNCESQKEIDYFWERLSEDGEQEMCGWLTDKFGVSWQVVPTVLGELLIHPSKSYAVIKALLTMYKIDIEQLLAAYAA